MYSGDEGRRSSQSTGDNILEQMDLILQKFAQRIEPMFYILYFLFHAYY